MSHHQNAGQNHNIKIANGAFENVAKLRYLGSAITNPNYTRKEIKKISNLPVRYLNA
jgi:hypothetical protein